MEPLEPTCDICGRTDGEEGIELIRLVNLPGRRPNETFCKQDQHKEGHPKLI